MQAGCDRGGDTDPRVDRVRRRGETDRGCIGGIYSSVRRNCWSSARAAGALFARTVGRAKPDALFAGIVGAARSPVALWLCPAPAPFLCACRPGHHRPRAAGPRLAVRRHRRHAIGPTRSHAPRSIARPSSPLFVRSGPLPECGARIAGARTSANGAGLPGDVGIGALHVAEHSVISPRHHWHTASDWIAGSTTAHA
jgi:hypothetical protein